MCAKMKNNTDCTEVADENGFSIMTHGFDVHKTHVIPNLIRNLKIQTLK